MNQETNNQVSNQTISSLTIHLRSLLPNGSELLLETRVEFFLSNSVFNPPVLFEGAVVNFRVTDPLPTTLSEAIDIPTLLGFDRD